MSAIREARINKGLSQKELARAVGIDARTLRKIENDEHVSDISRRAVERTLGVSVQGTIKPSSLPTHGWQFYTLFWCAVMGIIVALVGATRWFVERPFDVSEYGALAVAIFLIVFFAAGIFVLMLIPVRGNTRIEISGGFDRSSDLSAPLEMAKGWLGRQDVTLGKITTDKAGYRLNVFTNLEVLDYPTVIAKLKDFGLEASLHRAA
jgi:DNA-binding XRE family transcriptional regulator